MASEPPTGSRSRSKGKTKAVRAPSSSSHVETPEPDVVLPTYVPPAGALRSRAPGRQNIACRGCRRRKVKCDGSKPSCMSCQVIYKEPCVYDVKAAPAEAAVLEGQIADLRSLLDALVLAGPDHREQLLSEYAGKGEASSSGTRTVSPPSAGPAPSLSPLSVTVAIDDSRGSKRRAGDAEDEDAGGSRGSHSPDDDMAAAMLSELSFAASGHVEHFGATSFLHRPTLGAKPSPAILPDSPSASPGQLGGQLGLHTYSVPVDLRNHLLDIFFLWQTVHCHVYKPALLRDLDGGPFCSEFLLNVIFAHAARFSNRSDVRSSTSDVKTAGGVFLARAKELLRLELEKPSSIPTAQGLLILGGRECACGNHSQGFLYTAMGLSMAIDLGVHLDGTKIGAMNHDPMETEVRKRLYWSSYLWDKSISLCLGRAPRFLKSDKSFFGPAPIFDKSEDDVPWRPQFTEMPEDLQHYPFFPFRSGIYFEKTCQLAEIIEEILLELYAGKRKPNGDLSLRRYTSMLESWRENLHPDLVIPPDAVVSPPPNRITLSMLYQATVILVNRPFSFGGWGPRLRASEELRADAKQRCRTAAHEIARLLQLYDQTFQFRNMNWLMGYCSYTAATIIVFDLHAPVVDVAREAGKHLEVILASLGSQTTVTPSVQRSIEIIRHLMVNAPPASGTVTPLTAHAAKRHKDQSVGSDTIGAWTFEALNPPHHAAAEQGAPSDSADFSSLQLPDDVLGELLASAGPLDAADPSGPSGLPPPILPEFPEAGPLSWLGASEDASRDWLSSYNWLQFGAPQ